MSTLTIKNGPLEGAWQTSSGKGVAVHFLEGSYPARRAAAEMRDAERAIAALEELLAPPLEHRGRPIDIYCTDAVASDVDLADARAAAPAVTAEQGILRVVQPDAPAEAIAYALTRRLVGRWFGQKAARATLFVNGIAGVVAGRTGAAPNPGDTDQWVRDERAAGRDVSIFTRERERAAAAYPDAADPLATSFLGFLIEAYGAERLRGFPGGVRSRASRPGCGGGLSTSARIARGAVARQAERHLGLPVCLSGALPLPAAAHQAARASLGGDRRLHAPRRGLHGHDPAGVQVPLRHGHSRRKPAPPRSLRRRPPRHPGRAHAGHGAAVVRDCPREPAHLAGAAGADVRAGSSGSPTIFMPGPRSAT